MKIAAVIPTRGDVDTSEILDTIPAKWQVVVWDNSQRMDLRVAARYAAILETDADVIYTQDDDCLIDVEAVAYRYERGRMVANMPRSRWGDYPDSALVGWGAIFDRSLPAFAFRRFARHPLAYEDATRFLDTADVVFSALVPRTIIDVGFRHLPWAETDGRMFRRPGHKAGRDRILEVCRRIRTWPDDDVRIES